MRTKILFAILVSLIVAVLFVKIDGQSIPGFIANNYAQIISSDAGSLPLPPPSVIAARPKPAVAPQPEVPLAEQSDSYANHLRAKTLLTLLLNQQFAEFESQVSTERQRPVKYWNGRGYLYPYVLRWVDKFKVTPESLLPVLDKWLTEEPDNPIALTVRGAVLEQFAWQARGKAFAYKTKKEQFERMEALFERSYLDLTKALQINPDNRAAWQSLLGHTFHHQSRQRLKTDVFQQAIKHVPEHYHLYRRKQYTLTERWGGEPGDTLSFGRYHAAHAPEGSYLPLLVVEAHEEIGDWIERRRKTSQPKSITHKLVQALLERFFDIPADKSGNDTAKLISRGDYYSRPEVWAEITAAVETVLASHPRFSYAMLLYAELAYDAKKFDIAYDYYKQAIAIDPYFGYTDDWRRHALLKVARDYYNRNQHDQALYYYERYISFFPEKIEGYKWAGYLRGVQKDYVVAERYYRKLVELEPTNVVYMTDYCGQLHNLNRFEEALPFCEKAVKLDEENAHAYSMRAHLYTHAGRHDDAADDMKRYRQLIQNKKK